MAVGAGDVVRVDVRGLFNNATAVQNTWHLRNEGASQDEADVVDDMIELLETVYQLLTVFLQAALVIRDIRITNVSDNTDVGVGLFVDDTPGGGTGDVVPQNAYGLTLYTQRLAVRGRKFFGPTIPSGFTQDGVLTAGIILDLADVGDEVTVIQVATNSSWRYGVIATSDSAFLPFSTYGISPNVVTQRRRRVGVGE